MRAVLRPQPVRKRQRKCVLLWRKKKNLYWFIKKSTERKLRSSDIRSVQYDLCRCLLDHPTWLLLIFVDLSSKGAKSWFVYFTRNRWHVLSSHALASSARILTSFLYFRRKDIHPSFFYTLRDFLVFRRHGSGAIYTCSQVRFLAS